MKPYVIFLLIAAVLISGCAANTDHKITNISINANEPMRSQAGIDIEYNKCLSCCKKLISNINNTINVDKACNNLCNPTDNRTMEETKDAMCELAELDQDFAKDLVESSDLLFNIN